MRGYGSTVSTHYGTVTHSSAGLGVLQGDTIRNITGKFEGGSYGTTQGSFNRINYTTSYTHRDNPSFSDLAIINFSAASVVPTDNENRPINKSVIYLIKAR